MRRFFFTFFASVLIATPALAVDFKTPIRNIDGSVVEVGAGDKSPLTLGKVLQDALIANNLPGDTASTDEKGNRFRLALKVHAGKDPLTAEEVTLAKKVIGLAYGPLIIGRVTELLDPASIPK